MAGIRMKSRIDLLTEENRKLRKELSDEREKTLLLVKYLSEFEQKFIRIMDMSIEKLNAAYNKQGKENYDGRN